MKNIIFAALISLAVVGCGSLPSKEAAIRDQTIGSVHIKYDSDGNWIEISATGVAPLPDSSAHSTAQSAKIAAMHAKQNIADFMNNKFESEKDASINSTSTVRPRKEGEKEVNDMETITIVTERMRDSSSAILRGLQVTSQTNESKFVTVEMTATKRSIAAAQSIKNVMGN